MLPWRSNNHAALREIDNLPVANSAVNPKQNHGNHKRQDQLHHKVPLRPTFQ